MTPLHCVEKLHQHCVPQCRTPRSRARRVVSHIWQMEVNLIGNVTNPDRMSTKTLSFPKSYFFSDKLCNSAKGVCSVASFKASKLIFVAKLFWITPFAKQAYKRSNSLANIWGKNQSLCRIRNLHCQRRRSLTNHNEFWRTPRHITSTESKR